MQSLQSQFQEEMNNAGIDLMLSPETLLNPEATMQSKSKALQLIESISEYESAYLNELDQAEKYLSSREDGEGLAFYRGFIGSKQQAIQWATEYYEVERQIFETTIKILDFAIENAGEMQIYEGELVLQDQESIDKYVSYVATLVQLVEQENQIINRTKQKLQSGIEAMENLQ